MEWERGAIASYEDTMNDEKTDALTDMAYYHGARHAMTALSAGMDQQSLNAEMEARVAPARKWLAENRRSSNTGVDDAAKNL
jgi:hypothetical protein